MNPFRPIFLLLTILLTTLVLGACATSEPGPTDFPNQDRDFSIEIEENDKICTSAEECVLAWTDCGSCECGTPINQQYADKYKQAYQEVCTNYRGPVCDMACPEVQLDCINHLCVAVEKED